MTTYLRRSGLGSPELEGATDRQHLWGIPGMSSLGSGRSRIGGDGMQRASGLRSCRSMFARLAMLAFGAMLAAVLLIADASSAATTHPPTDTWTPVSSPLVTASGLASVSCVNSTDCWAVGYSEPKQFTYTLTEHWNGAKWTIVSTPDRPNDQLSSIDCVSRNNCWSVGSTTSSALIQHWDGTDWSIVHAPSVTGMSQLSSVTCISSNDCWAVGGWTVGVEPENLSEGAVAEHWDGSTWSVASVPDGTVGKGHVPTYLTGVSCVNSEDCWASGNYAVFTGFTGELITPVFAIGME